MTCMKQEFCIHEKYCQRHIGQNFDSCILLSRNSKPMTNEEYIRTCSPAELVHVIHLMTTSCYVCGSDGVDYRRCYFRKQCTGPKEIEEWLKEIHHE